MNAEQTFKELIQFLERYDGLELLCQASLTFLFAPEGVFHSESDDVQIWGRRLEFAAGFYAARGIESGIAERVAEPVLDQFKALIDNYYLSIDREQILRAREGSLESFSVESARIHSLHVRGEAYPHQFEEYARELYGEHDEWFEKTLGFTISDAYAVATGMNSQLNERHARLRISTWAEAQQLVATDTSWVAAGLSKADAERSAMIQLFFGHAKEHYRFSLDDISKCSGLATDKCVAVLKRLSQRPPFRNPLFLSTFEDAKSAPWDYNTMSERPLITDGADFWLVIPYLFRRILYYTFYFDLMADRVYKSTFERARGSYLERKTADYLRRIFPPSAVLLNPSYPDGNEFSDILVLHDGKILVVQCKGKTLTRPAHIGANAESIKSDVQKAIKDAVEQGARGRKYLEAAENANLVYEGIPLSIEMDKVTSIDIVAVTLMPLHAMATRIREVEEDLGMTHSEFPAWAVSLGDLDIVSEICHSPARLLQYLRRRMLLEAGTIRVHGDEMDLLGFFLTQGLWMEDEEFVGTNLLAISGFSGQIDEYVFRRWDCNQDVVKPAVARPDGFYALVEGIEGLGQLHRTDCAITILDVSGNCSKKLLSMISLTKEKTLSDGKSHSVSLQGNEGVTGISFQSFPQDTSARFVDDRTEGFGVVKKYSEKLDAWVALSWVENDKTQIDRAFWVQFPWKFENALEEIAASLRTTRQPS